VAVEMVVVIRHPFPAMTTLSEFARPMQDNVPCRVKDGQPKLKSGNLEDRLKGWEQYDW
jgi:hypothetical protein